MNRLIIKNGKSLATRALLSSNMPVMQQQVRMMRVMNQSQMMQTQQLLFKNQQMRMFSEETKTEGEDVVEEQSQEEKFEDLHKYANLGQEIFLNNLSDQFTDEEIQQKFSQFGEFLRFKRLPELNTSSGKCWIAFESAEKAKEAVEQFADDGYSFEAGDKPCYVKLSMTQDEAKERQGKRKQGRDRQVKTVYVGNLNFRVEDWQLEDYFMQFGQINAVRLGRDESGRSKGFAHIEFSTRDEADIAVNEAAGTLFEGRPLRMGHADKKPDRKQFNRPQYDE